MGERVEVEQVRALWSDMDRKCSMSLADYDRHRLGVAREWMPKLLHEITMLRAAAARDAQFGVHAHASGTLNDLAGFFQIDGDYMRCRKCKRPQIVTCGHEDFQHRAGCLNKGRAPPRPWQIMATATVARQDAGTVPEGWKLVPAEATLAMRDGLRVGMQRCASDDGWDWTARQGYAAMLAAAPSPTGARELAQHVPGAECAHCGLTRGPCNGRCGVPTGAREGGGA